MWYTHTHTQLNIIEALKRMKGFPCGSGVRNPPANAGDEGLIPGSGRAPGEGNGNHSSTLAWEIS